MKYVVYNPTTGNIRKFGVCPEGDVQAQTKKDNKVIIVDSLERNMDLKYKVNSKTKKLVLREAK